jgi:hypothetical protein
MRIPEKPMALAKGSAMRNDDDRATALVVARTHAFLGCQDAGIP